MNKEQQICDALGGLSGCEHQSGLVRFTTHCVYPSFEPVVVFVVPKHGGFYIHDNGISEQECWLLGRDKSVSSKILAKESARFGLEFKDGKIGISITSIDWLKSAVLSLANAASISAMKVAEKAIKVTEQELSSIILTNLKSMIPERNIANEFRIIGNSGKVFTFDFAITGLDQKPFALIDAVVPFPTSIYSKFTAFSDVEKSIASKFAIYRDVLSSEDMALLDQVTDSVMPASAMQNKREVFTSYEMH